MNTLIPTENDTTENIETINPIYKNNNSSPNCCCCCQLKKLKKTKKLPISVGGVFLFTTLFIGPVCTAIFSIKDGDIVGNLEIHDPYS
jgi:hypothetical protein